MTIIIMKSDYIKEIIKSRGEDYYNKNHYLLDAEFEYIKSLGDPSNKARTDTFSPSVVSEYQQKPIFRPK